MNESKVVEVFQALRIALPFVILGAVVQRNIDMGWNEPFASIIMVCFALIYYYLMGRVQNGK